MEIVEKLHDPYHGKTNAQTLVHYKEMISTLVGIDEKYDTVKYHICCYSLSTFMTARGYNSAEEDYDGYIDDEELFHLQLEVASILKSNLLQPSSIPIEALKNNSGEMYLKEFSTQEEFPYHRKFFVELAVLYGCNHKNIIRPLSFDTDPADLSIKLEYGGRDLFSLIRNGEETTQYFSQLVEGLKYLHSKGIIHCDIKPSNCVIRNGTLKIIDFGISALSWETRTGKERLRGTINYMDPTVDRKNIKYDPEYDMWSSGCVLVMMLQRRPAFWNESIEKGGINQYEETMEFARETMMKENPFPLIRQSEYRKRAIGLLSLDRTLRACYF